MQQPGGIQPMLLQCWTGVVDGGPTLKQHQVNISCWSGDPPPERLLFAPCGVLIAGTRTQ